jgi:rhomboid protease GluP
LDDPQHSNSNTQAHSHPLSHSPQSDAVVQRGAFLKPKFYLTTWTGRILAVNTIIFIAMTIQGGSIFLPSPETLSQFGAKDPVGLALGQWWRLFTPMFVHVGIIHFGLNSLALYYVGQHIEHVLGKRWFLAIYLLSGLTGGIASAVFTVGLSAGASGAIFGLLGVGLVYERLIARQLKIQTGQKLRKGPYTGLVFVNILMGFIISMGDTIGIDNAAHMGGLAGGMLLTVMMLSLRPNRLVTVNKMRAAAILFFLVLVCGYGAYVGTSSTLILKRLESNADSSSSSIKSYEYYTRAIAIDPTNHEFRFKRGRLLMLNREVEEGLKDFASLKNDPAFGERLNQLSVELGSLGLNLESLKLQDFIESKTE